MKTQPSSRTLLVKQEPHDRLGNAKGDLAHEWRVHQFLKQPDLLALQVLTAPAIDFDAQHSILIADYLTDYCDLDDFYTDRQTFPIAIAMALGSGLAKIHRATLDRKDYKAFLIDGQGIRDDDLIPDFAADLEDLTPDLFATVPVDGLKFYELYQRSDRLQTAIAELSNIFEPCCLTHNDLKFNNVLLHRQWHEPSENRLIRLIDWEKATWGDPAFDLGTIIASYLKLWLKSLIVSQDIDLDMALRLAAIPLEELQPSIAALTRSYLAEFPEIVQRFPDFLTRVLRFTGMGLIESIQARLYYQEPFGNVGICMLQVAKTLLCQPEQSLSTIFGGFDVEQAIEPQIMEEVEEIADWLGFLEDEPAPKPVADRPWLLEPEAVLQDIAAHLDIPSDTEICHAHYAPLDLLDADRLLQLPQNLRDRYLSRQLRNYLYDIYFSGIENSEDAQPSLKNDSLAGVNLAFYDRLHHGNCGIGYADRDWRVLRQEDDDTIVVQKEGLTLHLDRHRHLSPADLMQPIQIGESLTIQLPRNRVETGYYIAVGNAGRVLNSTLAIALYFNVTPDGAIALMQALTQFLNDLLIPFTLKAIVDPAEYDRYDPVQLTIGRVHFAKLAPWLHQRYADWRSEFRKAIPGLTKVLLPGLSVAEEPMTGDFGRDRFQVIAEALWMAHRRGLMVPHDRLSLMRQCFAERAIDPQFPYLSTNSKDIYTAWESPTAGRT